jgi:zinc transport system permease protein
MDILAYAFMQKALLAGILVGILCSFVAFFVVLKRLAFAGVGISHSAFGGVAIGLFFGFNPILTGGLFATLIALAIGFVSRHGDIQEDTSIGIFFATAMALGITVVSLIKGCYVDLFSYLFGNILAVTVRDLWILAGAASIIVFFLSVFFKELFFMCFDEELAAANGIPVNLLYYLLLACIAGTVVITVKVVGIILASALLVIPAATAYELTGNFRRMLVISISMGIISTVGGLGLSYYFNLASGSTIVLLAGLFFLAALVFSPRRKAWHRAAALLPESKPENAPEYAEQLRTGS